MTPDPDGRPEGEEPDDLSALAALAEADDPTLIGMGLAVLAELKDRNLLRILLRHRGDAASAFEAEAVRLDEAGAVEVVVEGLHAETPDHYALWVQEAEALHEGMSRDGRDPETEALLGSVADEALLIALDRARDAGTAAGADVAERIGIELMRRGVVEALDDP
jgi:hypothetical protein